MPDGCVISRQAFPEPVSESSLLALSLDIALNQSTLYSVTVTTVHSAWLLAGSFCEVLVQYGKSSCSAEGSNRQETAQMLSKLHTQSQEHV